MNNENGKKRSAASWLAELAGPRVGEYLLSVLTALAHMVPEMTSNIVGAAAVLVLMFLTDCY